MAANPVNPGPSAGAAPVSSAPVASPAPAVSTPTPSPAPAVTPASETPKPTGNSVLDKITDAWSKTSSPSEEPVAEPVTEPTAPPEVTTEVVEPAAEVVTEPEVAAEPEVVAEPETEAVPELILDEWQGGPKEFVDAIKGDEAATKFFNDHPEIKNGVSAALRRNEENKLIAKHGIFPQNAPLIAKAAATWQNVDNKFLAVESPETAQEFLNMWAKEAMYFDDKGQPIKEADGSYKLHPAMVHTIDHVYSNKRAALSRQLKQTGKPPAPMFEDFNEVLSSFESQAKVSGNERLQEVIKVLREETNALSSPASGELPDALKPLADSLKADRAALDEQKQAAARQQQESRQADFNKAIDTSESKAADNFVAQLKPQFAKAGLTPFESEAALNKIGKMVDEKLLSHDLYQSFRASVEQQLRNDPGNAKLQGELTKLMLTYGQEELGKIAGEVIRAAKGGALTRQSARETTVTQQRAASAADPRGTSITPSAPVQQTPQQMRTQIVKEYMDAHNGDRPDTQYIVSETWKRTQAAAQKKAS